MNEVHLLDLEVYDLAFWGIFYLECDEFVVSYLAIGFKDLDSAI